MYIIETNWFSDFVLLKNSLQSLLQREKIFVKSENQFVDSISNRTQKV